MSNPGWHLFMGSDRKSWMYSNRGMSSAHRYLRADGVWVCLSGKIIFLCSGASVSKFQVPTPCGKGSRATTQGRRLGCSQSATHMRRPLYLRGQGSLGAETFPSILLILNTVPSSLADGLLPPGPGQPPVGCGLSPDASST